MGHIERREFLRLLALGGVGFVLDACSSSSPPTSEPTPTLEPTRTPYPSPQTLPGGPRTVEKPKSASEPRREERKEVLPTRDIRIQPVAIEEIAEGVGLSEGWKWVLVYLLVENTGQNYTKLPKIKGTLKTKEGPSYEVVDVPSFYISMLNEPGHTAKQKESGQKLISDYDQIQIPPGFRFMGFNTTLDKMETVVFLAAGAKVGVKTSAFSIEIPGYQKIDLSGVRQLPKKWMWGEVLNAGVKFPTDKPDSEFQDFGKILQISPHGEITPRVKHANQAFVRLSIDAVNKNIGYDQPLSLKCIGVFSDNGILYPNFDPPTNYKIGPGVTKTQEFGFSLEYGFSNLPKSKSTKLVLSINGEVKIFNFEWGDFLK